MKNSLLLFISFFLFTSCGSNYIVKEYIANTSYNKLTEPDPVFIQKTKIIPTFSQKGTYNFMHINGFKSASILTSKILKDKDSKYLNQLNFYATYSSFYSGQLMYENFGDWNKYIKYRGNLILVWENVILFPNTNEKFTVYAFGYECTTCEPDGKSIYTSFSVTNSLGKDCLVNSQNELKNKIINFFSSKIKNLTNSNIFYNKYWGLKKSN